MIDEHGAAIELHYGRVWGAPSKRVRLTDGPIADLPRCFEVLVVRKPDNLWAFATRCMSEPEDEQGIEIHVISRSQFAWEHELVEVLTVVAHYHRTGRRLDVGHTVNIGRPIVPGSRCTHGLISPPYLDGPKLEWMAIPKTRFLWFVPVTESEVEFKKQHGLDALESRFEETQFDYADFFRDPVA